MGNAKSMTTTELILKLQEIESKHGRGLPIGVHWEGECRGGGVWDVSECVDEGDFDDYAKGGRGVEVIVGRFQ